MRRLKILVGLVLRVAIAVVGEAEAPAPLAVVTDDVPTRRPLVDVVAEKKDGVEILARQVRVRRVVALHVVLAGGEGETERLRCGARGRRRAGSADGALDTARAEAIPVHPVRIEATHFDVDRMGELREGARSARAHNVFHSVIAGNEPFDADRGAATGGGLEQQPIEVDARIDALGGLQHVVACGQRQRRRGVAARLDRQRAPRGRVVERAEDPDADRLVVDGHEVGAATGVERS